MSHVRAFDDACMADAKDAGLSGTFTAATVGNRIAHTTYARTDGVELGAWYCTGFLAYTPKSQVTADGRTEVSAQTRGWPSSPDLIIDDPTVWKGGCVEFLSAQLASSAFRCPDHRDDESRRRTIAPAAP
jgi:hypothetical protein